MDESFWDHVSAPWGRLTVVTDARGSLVRVDLAGRAPVGTRNTERCRPVASQLAEYFAGTRRTFTLPIEVAGTEFQKRVWTALCTIPYGEVMSYGELAGHIGNPRAARAVGSANGANPVPIVIPCHRVIAAGRALGGFAGGLHIKRVLLGIEGCRIDGQRLAA